MPDFERLTDQLRIDMARTPLERARAEGFNAGKRYARKEIALTVAFTAVFAAVVAATVVV